MGALPTWAEQALGTWREHTSASSVVCATWRGYCASVVSWRIRGRKTTARTREPASSTKATTISVLGELSKGALTVSDGSDTGSSIMRT